MGTTGFLRDTLCSFLGRLPFVLSGFDDYRTDTPAESEFKHSEEIKEAMQRREKKIYREAQEDAVKEGLSRPKGKTVMDRAYAREWVNLEGVKVRESLTGHLYKEEEPPCDQTGSISDAIITGVERIGDAIRDGYEEAKDYIEEHT